MSQIVPVLAIGLLESLYVVSVLCLSLYGLHAFWMTAILLRRSQTSRSIVPADPVEWPPVTVQLPIYNERHVVERLINSVAALDYPADRLHIQVLDDSDDSTLELSAEAAALWHGRGIDIDLVRRPTREGYKAGALAHALPLASGDFIAIFDADFVAPRDFLKRTIPHFCAQASERVAFVQARWEHLNRDYSMLTRCQALALDGHFGVEQPARNSVGFAFGFNGSAGIWRRTAIEDPAVGGWQTDTLCEDLDLAYRAQLAGWRGRFLVDSSAPAEVPPQLLAFKRQQARWARGSVQTLMKLGGRVWASKWSLPKRLAALLHMGNYLLHPLLILLVLTIVPLILIGVRPPALLAALSIASLGSPFLYGVAQRRLHPTHWLANWIVLPLLTLFGIGLSLGNTIAVSKGLRSQGGDFARTPKFHVMDTTDAWRSSAYRLPVGWQTSAEAALALFCLTGVASAARQGDLWTAAYVGLFAASFATMVCVELWQARHVATAFAEPHRWHEPEGRSAVDPGS